MTDTRDMKAFEKFIDKMCVHDVPIHDTCPQCEKEIAIDFVVHNIEELSTEEATQCIRDGIMTLGELEDGLNRRIRAG